MDYIDGNPKYPLLLQLYHPDFVKRARAIMNINQNGELKYISFITPLLNDPDDSVRWAILKFIENHDLIRKRNGIREKLERKIKNESNKIIQEKIMELLVKKLDKINNDPMIVNNRVKVKIIGRRETLTENILKLIDDIEEKTKNYDQHILNVALSYGGRAEIVDAVRKIAAKVREEEIEITEINEETINDHLYTEGIPDPDLIIRTSGEERLSGFLLWQSAYSELYFTDIYWPAFRKIDLWRAIRIFQQRERRYGK